VSAPPPRSERIAGARVIDLGLHEVLVALLERPAESEAVAIRAASPAAPVYPHAPLMADLVDRIRAELQVRIRELRPVVREFERLEKAAAALAEVDGGGHGGRRRRAAARGTRRRGRPRGSGTRSLQALELVKAQPGITISELADAMGIKANYLYRVLPQLEADGKVKKRKKGWHPA
jgi:hypothetical protein